MKHLLLSFCLFTTLAYGGNGDNETKPTDKPRVTDVQPKMDDAKATAPHLVPEANVLFFNQDYTFKVEGESHYTVQSVTMDKASCTLMAENSFNLNVWWSNGDEKTVTLLIKITDESGKESTIERKVLLQQKLPSPYLDNALYKLDEKEIDTDLGLQRDDLLKATKLQFNSQNFTIHNVQLTSFKLRIGNKAYSSPDGVITPEMKDAVNGLGPDANIQLEDVQGTYKAFGENIKFNLNYKSVYKVVFAG